VASLASQKTTRSPLSSTSSCPSFPVLGHRAREQLDAIYDTLMQVSLSVKPILVTQLREVHAIVYRLERQGALPRLRMLVGRGLLKPEDLPPWARMPEPPSEPAAAALENSKD
jgi:hypothetical protein